MQLLRSCFRPTLVMLLALLVWTATPAFSQDNSASGLLRRGLEHLNNGNYVEARETLARIDRTQLSERGRSMFDAALEKIEKHYADQPEPPSIDEAPEPVVQPVGPVVEPVVEPVLVTQTTVEPAPVTFDTDAAKSQAQQNLAEAKALESRGKLERAKQLYIQVNTNIEAPRALRAEAEAGLRRVQARMNGQSVPTPAPTTPTNTTTVVTPVGPGAGVLGDARRLRGQELAALGAEAEKAGNYNQARSYYEQALSSDPTNAEAAAGSKRVMMLLDDSQAVGGGVLGSVVQAHKLRAERARARFDLRMKEAEEAEAAGNYDKAIDAATVAKQIVDMNRQYLAEEEWKGLREQAAGTADRIRQKKEQQRIVSLEQEQDAIRARAEQDRMRAENQNRAQVQELLKRARDLSRQRKYDQALEQIDQILFIDPMNTAASYMKDLITDQMIQAKWDDLRKQRGIELSRTRVQTMADMVPNSDLIVYPPDWPELTYRRLSAQDQSLDSEANRIAREKLQQPIPVEFRANQFQNVIEYLRNVTGANVFVQWTALEAAGIERETPITMQLQNVAAEKALRLVLDEAGGDLVKLGYTIDEGVVVIATKEFLAQKTELRTYDIKDLVVQIPSFAEAPEFDLNQIAADPSGGGGGGQSIFEDVDQDSEDQLPRSERILQIMDLIRNSIDPENWRSAGGLTSSMEELNGTLIVNTTAENHVDMASLLRRLREQRALQIAVESRFLFVTQNFMEEVGIDVDIAFDDDPPSWIAGNPVLVQDSITQAHNPGTSIDGSLPTALASSALAIGAGTLANGVSSGLGFLIDDLRVDVMIRATQADQRTITVNTPRITLFNGQRSFVTVSRQIAFVSDLEPVVATQSVSFDPEIDVVSDGIVLDVEATISADRRYVTMTARPSLAQLTNIRNFVIVGGVTQGGDGIDNDGDGQIDEEQADGIDNDGDGLIDEDVGGQATGSALQQSGFIQQPEIQLTTIRTTVSVPDKGTLLLGGQRLAGEVELEAGVPVLSKIPVINRLFTNRSTARDERTLLILIKPTIIVQSEEEERLFPGLNQSPGLYNTP